MLYINEFNLTFSCFSLADRHGFLIDIKKVFGHLIEDNCNWPSVNLMLGEKVRLDGNNEPYYEIDVITSVNVE